MQNLGLNEKTIADAILANGAFLLKGVEVQQVINNSLTNYRAFIRWLYVVILRLMGEQMPTEIPKMAQQDVTDITEFLQNFDCLGNTSSGQKGRFKLERLGQYLVDAPLTILPKNDGNIWSSFLQENENLVDNNLIIKHVEHMSLIQQYKYLVKSVENIFIEPNKFVSNNFKFLQLSNCLNVSNMNNTVISYLNSENSTLVIFHDDQSDRQGVYIIEINTTNYVIEKGAFLYLSRIPEIGATNGCKILDVKFYSSTYLSLLLQEENTILNHQYLCQTPIKCIKNSLTNLATVENTTTPILIQKMNHLDICEMPGNIVKRIEGMTAVKFQVSSSRHVCVVLSDNHRKVQLFEMEAEEEEEELDDTFVTANTTRDTDGMLTSSVASE